MDERVTRLAERIGDGFTRVAEAGRETAVTFESVGAAVSVLHWTALQGLAVEPSRLMPEGAVYVHVGRAPRGHPDAIGRLLARAWASAQEAGYPREERALLRAARLRVREGHRHEFLPAGRFYVLVCACGVEREPGSRVGVDKSPMASYLLGRGRR